MGGKKFLSVGVSSQQNVVRWNSLLPNQSFLLNLSVNLLLVNDD